jgi:hypothetical protein
VTLHALAGLGALNLAFLVSGVALLWLVRGFETWGDVARLGGLAYLTGVVAVCSTWTLLLIAGLSLSLALVLAVPIGIALGCLIVGRRRGRPRPRLGEARPSTEALVVSALGLAAVGVFLEAAFRSARLTGLYNWDAWAFWVPKAKAIYFFGGLDRQFYTLLPGSSYPPLVPVLDAGAFRLMGSPDVVTLHLQYWLFGLGFLWAVVGLLSERVHAWILWPVVLLALTMPRVGLRLDIPEADLFLDYLFVTAALLVFLWLRERQRWELVIATILLCGAVLAKREGLLLVAVLMVAALLAGAREMRAIWRPLLASVCVVGIVAIPWRVWYIARGVSGEAPEGGLLPSADTGRLWASLRLAVRVLFENGYWSVLVPVAVGALVLAALARAWTTVVFFGTLIALVTLGGGWIVWAIPELEITEELGANPIVRFMGAAALLCAAAVPLLLATAWSPAAPAPVAQGSRGSRPMLVALALVAGSLLVYPLAVLAADGLPRFPTRNECVQVATEDGPGLDVVYGRFDNPVAAEERLAAVTRVGFVGAEVELDACGRWKVSYDAIDSLAQGEALAKQVRAAGFDARVEHES